MQDDVAEDNHNRLKTMDQLAVAERQAQVRKLNADAALVEAKAEHKRAEAEQVRLNTQVASSNLILVGLQVRIQENTVRLQTAQVDKELKNLGAGSAPN